MTMRFRHSFRARSIQPLSTQNEFGEAGRDNLGSLAGPVRIVMVVDQPGFSLRPQGGGEIEKGDATLFTPFE